MPANNLLVKESFGAKRLMVISKKMEYGSVSVLNLKKGWSKADKIPFFIDPRAINLDFLVVVDKEIENSLLNNEEATISFKLKDTEYLAKIISYRLQVTENLIAEILPIFRMYHDDDAMVDRIKRRESVFVQIRLADLERL